MVTHDDMINVWPAGYERTLHHVSVTFNRLSPLPN